MKAILAAIDFSPVRNPVGHNATLIATEAYGHTAFFDLVVGSTARVMLKRARQPEVVIPRATAREARVRVAIAPNG